MQKNKLSSFDCILEMIYRSSHRRCSIKKVLLEISQNSQENTCARVWHRCFPVNFAKFLRAPFLQNTSGRVLLDLYRLEITRELEKKPWGSRLQETP